MQRQLDVVGISELWILKRDLEQIRENRVSNLVFPAGVSYPPYVD